MNPRSGESGADWLLQHASWVRRLAHSLVADPTAAEDLVQDAWVAALTHPPATDRSLRPWLATVLRNLARKAARHRRHRDDREARATAPAERPAPEELCEQLDAERLLTEELARLDEPYRSTLLLRYYEDLAPIEIARREGIPPGTVRWRIKTGLERLRERLDASSGNDRRTWCLLLVPLVRSEGSAASVAVPSVAVTGVLAMNALLKVGAAIAVVLVAYIGLTIAGVLPDPLLRRGAGGAPVEVSFRPIEEEPEGEEIREAARLDAGGTRAAVVPAAARSDDAAPGPLLGAIEARIVDDVGTPVRGARLCEVLDDGSGATALAGASGDVRLELPPPSGSERVRVEARKRGFASRVEEVKLAAGATVELGTLVLVPGGMISGRVVDEKGRGFAGAHISGIVADETRFELEAHRYVPRWREEQRRSRPHAITDEAGEFLLSGIAAGYWRLWVEGEDHLPTFTEPVEVRVGSESFGLEIVLPSVRPEDHIFGIVLDPDGKPVPHALLRFNHSSRKGGLSIHGDERKAKGDGTFDFLLFPDARMTITAADPEGRFGSASADDVATGEGRLVLQLTDLARIPLAVRSEEGVAVERFAVRILAADEEITLYEEDVEEHFDGRTEFSAPNVPFRIRIQAPLHQLAIAGPFDPAESGGGIEVRLESVPGLSGRVVAGDAAIAGAEVAIFAATELGETTHSQGFFCKLMPIAEDETRTDEEGAFRLTAYEEGEYYVTAIREGYALAEAGPITLRPEHAAAPIELHLGRGGAIEGRIVPPADEEAAGRIVGISRGDGHARSVRVGADGHYRFDGLTPGRWLVEEKEEEIFGGRRSITTRPGSRAPFDEQIAWSCEVFEEETTRFDLRLADETLYRLAGTMHVEGRQRQAWVARLHRPETDLMQWMDGPGERLDHGGSFELGVAEPGRYLLVIKSSVEEQDEQFFIDEVSLERDVTEWGIDLDTGSLLLEGIAPMPEGQDVPDYAYLWKGRGALGYFSAIFPDENGTYLLRAVPVGTGKIVRPDLEQLEYRRWEAVRTVEIIAGEQARLELK